MDGTGTHGIEPLAGKLVAFKNSVGVYTNTPSFSNHLKKMNKFLGLQEDDFSASTKSRLVELEESSITGRNASDRFILAAHARWGKEISTKQELISFLRSVTIPNNHHHLHNCTRYQAIIDCASGEYRFYGR